MSKIMPFPVLETVIIACLEYTIAHFYIEEIHRQ